MEIFPREVALRGEIGARYNAKFAQTSAQIVLPYVAPENTSVYAQYTIQVDAREALQAKLKEAGIPTAVHYPVPLHLQPVFASLQLPEGSFPVSETMAKRVMSLPMSPFMAASTVDQIVAAVIENC